MTNNLQGVEMDSLTFSIAPDVSPQRLPGWHLFTSLLQREMKLTIKILEYRSFEEQKIALQEGKIDLLYANPYDAAWLIREQNFIGIAQPSEDVAEVCIVAKKEGDLEHIEDLPKSSIVSAATNADLRTLGTILLEPANLTKNDISFIDTANHILAVKEVLNNNANVAMLPTEIYNGLSNIIAKQLKCLVATESKDIETVAHCFVLSPQFSHQADTLKNTLKNMSESKTGRSILDDINVNSWKTLDNPEDITFMIDLIYTLQI